MQGGLLSGGTAAGHVWTAYRIGLRGVLGVELSDTEAVAKKRPSAKTKSRATPVLKRPAALAKKRPAGEYKSSPRKLYHSSIYSATKNQAVRKRVHQAEKAKQQARRAAKKATVAKFGRKAKKATVAKCGRKK